VGATFPERRFHRGLDLPLARAGADRTGGFTEPVDRDLGRAPDPRELVLILDEPHGIQDRARIDQRVRAAAGARPRLARPDQDPAHEGLQILAPGSEAEVHAIGPGDDLREALLDLPDRSSEACRAVKGASA